MSSIEWFWAIAATAIRYAPNILVGSICLWLAVSRRRRHPRVSNYAIVGAAGLLLVVLVAFAMQATLGIVQEQLTRATQISTIISYFTIAIYPINLIALGFLVAAIFIDRGPVSN